MVYNMLRFGEECKVTQNDMDNIANYMNDEIREKVHFKFASCEPEVFLREYVKRDPGFEKLLHDEFGIEME